MRRSKLVINCQPTLSPILKAEVQGLGYRVLRAEKNGVTVEGGWKEVMHLNLHLRTASRVLWLIKSFEANRPDAMYDEAKKIPWHKLLPKDTRISVQSYVKNDFISDGRFANLKLKDAIVDKMLEETGSRPDSGNEKDHTVVYMFWHLNKVHIYFDTSGETITKHGYRKLPYKAPMLESLAAACLISAGWREKKYNFINPMCGSGTLAIEAALMASGIPPGLNRDNFGFMHIDGYDPQLWEDTKDEIRFVDNPKVNIIATDWNGMALEAATTNAREAGVYNLIEFDKCSFEDTFIPNGEGIVMLNPEYGERLGEEDELREVYKGIGDFFKKSCGGKMGYIFTGNTSLAKSIGLRTKSRTEMMNARIECRLLEYELYGGSRR